MNTPGSPTEKAAKSKMNCPVCAVSLVMTERQNIEIDYCPDCRGIWLDRGELDKIIERSLQPHNAGPQDDGRDNRNDDKARRGKHGGGHHGRGYGRRSWLSEIFD